MNECTAISVARRITAPTRIAFVVVVLIASIVHVRAAQMRTSGLLDHDEAISLLAAAGKADRANLLYRDQASELPTARSAASLQQLLRPTGDTGFEDVSASLRDYDIHPPLYFWLLHAAQRCGVRSEMLLRLLGSIMLLLTACILDRLVWPESNPLARLLAFAILLLSPPLIATAIELRQYALLMPGFALTLAVMVRMSVAGEGWRTNAVLIAIASALLLWTHFGTTLWLLIWLQSLFLVSPKLTKSNMKAIAFGLVFASVLAWPVLSTLWGMMASRAGANHLDALSLAKATLSVLVNFARPWVSVPWRFRDTWAAILPTLGVFFLVMRFVRKGSRLDATIFAIAGIWLVIWIGLLANGKLPPHAIRAKYLMAPMFAIMAVLVRCCDKRQRRSQALLFMAVGGAALLTHVTALPGILTLPRDAAIAESIGDVQTVFVNDPKRGYLFPIVDEIPATANVWIMRPLRMPIDPAAIVGPLLVLEVKPLPGFPTSDAAGQLCEFLSSQYEQRKVLADGPRRRMTLFRGRQPSAAAFGTD